MGVDRCRRPPPRVRTPLAASNREPDTPTSSTDHCLGRAAAPLTVTHAWLGCLLRWTGGRTGCALRNPTLTLILTAPGGHAGARVRRARVHHPAALLPAAGGLLGLALVARALGGGAAGAPVAQGPVHAHHSNSLVRRLWRARQAAPTPRRRSATTCCGAVTRSPQLGSSWVCTNAWMLSHAPSCCGARRRRPQRRAERGALRGECARAAAASGS
jgi:hypothetical protein